MKKNNINKQILLLFFSIVFFSCKPSEVSFHDEFQHIRNIYLDNSIMLSGVQSIDFNKKQQFIITDVGLKQVVLFDKDGKLLKILSMKKCDPGMNWEPYGAKFHPNGSIFVLNGVSGTWFNQSGECVIKTQPLKSVNLGFVIGHKGIIYAFGRGKSEITVFDSLGVKIKNIQFKDKFPIAHSLLLTDNVSWSKENILVTLPISSSLLEISTEGQIIKDIQLHNNLKTLKQDISSPDQIIESTREIAYPMFVSKKNDEIISTIFNAFNAKQYPDKQYSIGIMNKNGQVKKLFYVDKKFAFIGGFSESFYAPYIPDQIEKEKICPQCKGGMNVAIGVYKRKQ